MPPKTIAFVGPGLGTRYIETSALTAVCFHGGIMQKHIQSFLLPVGSCNS